MRMQKLKRLVEQVGGRVEIDVYDNEHKAIQVVAPDGKQWMDSNSVHLVGDYWTYIKGDKPGSRGETIRDLYNRVICGLEDYDEELNG